MIIKKNANDNVATFLNLNIRIEEGQFSTKLYDKRDEFNFSIVRLLYKYSNIPSKIFYSIIFAESFKNLYSNVCTMILYNDFL